jgi:hypothetical protein
MGAHHTRGALERRWSAFKSFSVDERLSIVARMCCRRLMPTRLHHFAPFASVQTHDPLGRFGIGLEADIHLHSHVGALFVTRTSFVCFAGSRHGLVEWDNL